MHLPVVAGEDQPRPVVAAVGVGDPVRLVEHQEVAAHGRLLHGAADDRGVGVDLLLAGGEADGAGRELRGQPRVGLVGQLAQRRGVDAAAVLGQRDEGVVGLAGVGRPEVEDDLLGAGGAHGELGLGAVHPALLGELSMRAAARSSSRVAGSRASLARGGGRGTAGETLTGEEQAFGRRKSGRVDASGFRGPYGRQPDRAEHARRARDPGLSAAGCRRTRARGARRRGQRRGFGRRRARGTRSAEAAGGGGRVRAVSSAVGQPQVDDVVEHPLVGGGGAEGGVHQPPASGWPRTPPTSAAGAGRAAAAARAGTPRRRRRRGPRPRRPARRRGRRRRCPRR